MDDVESDLTDVAVPTSCAILLLIAARAVDVLAAAALQDAADSMLSTQGEKCERGMWMEWSGCRVVAVARKIFVDGSFMYVPVAFVMYLYEMTCPRQKSLRTAAPSDEGSGSGNSSSRQIRCSSTEADETFGCKSLSARSTVVHLWF